MRRQAFVKLQAELMREGMIVEMGSEDPDGKNRCCARCRLVVASAELRCRVLVLITASMRQLMEEAELLQLAVRVKQVLHSAPVLVHVTVLFVAGKACVLKPTIAIALSPPSFCRHGRERVVVQEVYHNPDNLKRSLLNRASCPLAPSAVTTDIPR